MRPFNRPPALLPRCTQYPHRTISTTVTAARKRHKARGEQQQINQELQERAAILRKRIHEARVARREDWILGPLAPRRDKGNSEYGTLLGRELEGLKGGLGRGILTERRRGGVTAAAKKDAVDYRALASAEEGLPLIRPAELPIPLSSVRLVHEIPDPDLSFKTDKIIDRLIPLPDEKKAEIRAEFDAGRMDEQEMRYRLRGRTIPGSKEVYGDWLEIPLPKAEMNKRKREDTTAHPEFDTLRFEVEQRTWTPTLLRAPMPGGVIDELRNKYSRFRTRHDAGYQLALENRARRKAEYKAWAKSGGGMLMTPTKEARLAEREKLKAQGEPTLEKEVLERIGEVMAGRGIEMTGKRRREVAKNLRGEGVVKWGPGVEFEAAGKDEATRAVLEQINEEGEWEATGKKEKRAGMQ